MSENKFRGIPISELTIQGFSEQPSFPNLIRLDDQVWRLDLALKPQYIPLSYLGREGEGGFWRASYSTSDSNGITRKIDLFWDESQRVQITDVLPEYDELKKIQENKDSPPEFPVVVLNPSSQVRMTLKRVFWEVLIKGAWMGEYICEGQKTEKGAYLTYISAMTQRVL